jgi:hypothetical protein
MADPALVRTRVHAITQPRAIILILQYGPLLDFPEDLEQLLQLVRAASQTIRFTLCHTLQSTATRDQSPTPDDTPAYIGLQNQYS